jgi:hypothetical protein
MQWFVKRLPALDEAKIQVFFPSSAFLPLLYCKGSSYGLPTHNFLGLGAERKLRRVTAREDA